MPWYQESTAIVCFGQNVDVAIMEPDGINPVDIDGVLPWVKDSFAFHATFIRARLPGKQIVITSGRRDGGIHGEGRALDYIVEGMVDDPEVCQVLSELAGLCHIFFPYGGGNDGQWHWAFNWRTDRGHFNHVHWQGPPNYDGSGAWPRLL